MDLYLDSLYMALQPPSATKSKKKPVRRSPISRTEGEQRFIDAATELLRDNPFSSVGVRDIATRADVNQGFIHSWFGSQNDLYLRVVKELFFSMRAVLEQQPTDSVALNPLDPNVQFAVRLLFWLDLEGVDVNEVKPELDALMYAFTQRMITQIGLDDDTAAAITLQGSAIGLGTAAFGHLIGADDSTKFAHAILVWRRQLELLAKNPPK
jgi:AcrR family transcriptional regulator